MKSKTVLRYTIYYSLLVLTSLIILAPIFWMVSVSFRPNNEVFLAPPNIFPNTFSIEGYITVLKNPSNIRSFINSIIVSLAVTGIAVLITSIASYGISRFKFKGKQFITFFVLVTQMVPPIFLLLPYFVMISRLGLYDTYFGLIITYSSFTLPFCALMLRSFFDSIPISLDEAALIDGCSRIQVLFRIILPVNIPAIIATGAFAFILSWTELLFAVALNQTRNMMMSTVAIASYIGEFSMEWNALMAFSILASIPLVLAWIFLQKYIIEGMTSGSMKF